MDMKIRATRLTVGVVLAVAAPLLAQTKPPAQSREAIVEELVIANHILANEGVLDGYGHVSVRNPADPNRYLLARAGAPGLVTAADITEYDLDSEPITKSAAAGYIERFIHGAIYRARPDVMAVVHCHCPEVIPFGAVAVPMRPMYHMGYFIAEGVPETIAGVALSATGEYLKPMLERASIKPVIVDKPVKKPKRSRRVEADEPDLIAAK